MARRDRTPRQKRPAPRSRRRRAQTSARAERRVSLELPRRRVEPDTVVAHLGPTNSGKTHAALDELAARGRGV
jgi:ATP-dependent RNA helicase SUPV3L1/SUV3